MKHAHCLILLAGVLAVGHACAQTPIVPKGWLTPEALAGAQVPLQSQLDTGVAMVPTAWSMAQVKDAELFVLYIAVCETLPAGGRETLRQEQEKWLKVRAKAVAAADDGKSGREGRLAAAAEHQTITEARIAELKKRLLKKK